MAFNEIPTELRVPFTYVEFDPTQADQGSSLMPFNVLLPGQMLPSGEADPLVPIRITSEAQGIKLFGRGSQLAQMISAFLNANKFTKLTAIGVEDYSGGVQATGSITFSGAVTSPAPIIFYIGGMPVRAGTLLGDSNETCAEKLAAAINAAPDLPVTATLNDAEVTLTARHKGECGKDISIKQGLNQGEELPAGISVAITGFTGGAGNPDALDVVAAMGGERYHLIAWPWLDALSLTALKNELDARWDAKAQIDGQAVVVKTGSFNEVSTFASARNDKGLTVIPSEGSPTLPWVDCAACVAIIAYYGAEDPARPFQTLVIPGVLPPAPEDRWAKFPEKNQALYDGVSIRDVTPGGDVMFTSVITTYRVNNLGAETQAYLYLNTLLTLSYLRYDWNNYLQTKYPRHKLASDNIGKRQGNNQAIMTPSVGKAEALCRMDQWEREGLVEASDEFKKSLIVEIDANNPNRLNWYMKPNLVNQFRIGATQMTFLL